jgi:hypothetical protein
LIFRRQPQIHPSPRFSDEAGFLSKDEQDAELARSTSRATSAKGKEFWHTWCRTTVMS